MSTKQNWEHPCRALVIFADTQQPTPGFESQKKVNKGNRKGNWRKRKQSHPSHSLQVKFNFALKHQFIKFTYINLLRPNDVFSKVGLYSSCYAFFMQCTLSAHTSHVHLTIHYMRMVWWLTYFAPETRQIESISWMFQVENIVCSWMKPQSVTGFSSHDIFAVADSDLDDVFLEAIGTDPETFYDCLSPNLPSLEDMGKAYK